jgi:hypothetical protein
VCWHRPHVVGAVLCDHERARVRVGSTHLVRRTLLLAVLLVLPLPAQAQNDSALQGYLFSVRRLYESLEYEQALGQIARAKRFASTVHDDVILSLYEGIILADLNRWDESAATFKAGLFLLPNAPLPITVSPKVKEHFEAVRQEVLREIAAAKESAQPFPSNPPPPGAERSLAEAQSPRAGDAPSEKKPAPKRTERTSVAADAVPTASSTAAERGLLRPQVLIPAIGGGVLMAAGGTSWAVSRRELSRLRSADPSLATLEDIRRSASRGSTYQTVGVGLLGAGVVGVGIAAGLFIGMPSNSEVTLGMSTDGTSTFVRGRWP